MRRVLRDANYRFLHSRKKDLSGKKILKKRRKLAQKVTKMLIDKFWEEDISFYIDAAGFQYKHDPHDEAQSMQTVT